MAVSAKPQEEESIVHAVLWSLLFMVLGAIVGGAIFATAMHLLGATGGLFAGFITGIVLGNLIASEEE